MLKTVAAGLPSILKNTTLSISLSGWPATVAVIAVATSGVIIYALWVSHPESDSGDHTCVTVLAA